MFQICCKNWIRYCISYGWGYCGRPNMVVQWKRCGRCRDMMSSSCVQWCLHASHSIFLCCLKCLLFKYVVFIIYRRKALFGLCDKGTRNRRRRSNRHRQMCSGPFTQFHSSHTLRSHDDVLFLFFFSRKVCALFLACNFAFVVGVGFCFFFPFFHFISNGLNRIIMRIG